MAEIVSGAQINETHANVKRSRSRFALKEKILDTHRFGEYHPHFVLDGIDSDKHSVRSAHSSRSYTLKAPLMQNVQMHQDYFMVPLRAILPLQAERIITNPTIGDDVPSDAYTNVSLMYHLRRIFFKEISTIQTNSAATWGTGTAQAFDTQIFKFLIFFESFFSSGSLLSSLGCDLSTVFRAYRSGGTYTFAYFDEFFDYVINYCLSLLGTGYRLVKIDGENYDICNSVHHNSGANTITFHEFLARIRDTSNWYFVDSFSQADNSANIWKSCISPNFSTFTFSRGGDGQLDLDIDLARLWAYHLCCYEYYSNDKVDYIYSAEIFRQYIFGLIRAVSGFTLSKEKFSYNSMELMYDYLSAHYTNIVFDAIYSRGLDDTLPGYKEAQQYILTLFGYHRSLRFKDYFTGSRTSPLAVGNTNVPVVGSNVSVIDISRGIQMQRFLNSVNATGRKFGEYLKGLFGEAPSPDHHNPLFLAHTSDDIFVSEVENTGAAQQTQRNSVTAVFRGNGNQYAFEFDVKENCIIIGITSYDIERCYPHGVLRSFFTKDRFDMFLPQLQYVGDQEVYSNELNTGNDGIGQSNFGYQFRDMDRKQLINRASGAFGADRLPGYAFVYRPVVNNIGMESISPDFIRSRASELDEFYLSLAGYSLGHYFHFIHMFVNTDDASRPMAVNPQILG